MGRVAAWVLTFALMQSAGMRAAEPQAAESQIATQRGSRPERARDARDPLEAQGMGAAAELQTGTGPVAAAPETSVGAVLRNLASRSGVVFVGQVVRIERQTGTVEITFQVQQPVLGAVGATYVLREWSGLWSGGQSRFRLGQRAMLFLHSPRSGAGSTGGLSSPVDGMAGVVPVIVQGADTGALLDVRWLAARVLRAQGAPLADAENGAIALADGMAVAAGWRNADLPEPVQQPLPVGVRPAQPVQTQPGTSTGVFDGPKPRPVPPIATLPQPPSGAQPTSSVHDMVRLAAPGGTDAVR